VKKVISLIFLSLFSLQTFYSAGLIVWYMANQKAITQKHCINKKNPSLHCNGKCYLSKKIKEAEEKNEEKTNIKIKWEETAPCTLTHILFSIAPIDASITVTAPPISAYYFTFSRSIFHPPSVC
jgi:Na+/citrate or Na+/malate symporter